MQEGIEIVGVGEILLDVFSDGTETLGGAPLNVALQCDQLLKAAGVGRGIIVSALGKDARGEIIRSTLKARGLSTEFIAENALPTGTAHVSVAKEEAGFVISQNVAWDHIQSTEATNELAARCQAVTFGSLAQRSESRGAIRSFVAQVDGIRLYDVNLRKNTGSGLPGYTAETITQSCQLASIVKMNLAEIHELGSLLGFVSGSDDALPWTVMEEFLKNFALSGVIVTRGGEGALYYGTEGRVQVPGSSLRLSEVHPVGSGDAFTAGVLFGLSQGWRIEKSLHLASRMGEWVAQHVAATVDLSEEITAFVRNETLTSRS